jgi:ribonucleoside-triphosphate reductase
MRNIADVEKELAELQKQLAEVEGTPTEVYSRIVGYYRSVRNWNKGKREEYGERKLFDIQSPPNSSRGTGSIKTTYKPSVSPAMVPRSVEPQENRETSSSSARLLLFVRRACPNCPSAKAAAETLTLPLSLIDADTGVGLEEARRWNVWSTPTAILLSAVGKELARAQNAPSILAFKALPGFSDLSERGTLLDQGAPADLKNNASAVPMEGKTKIWAHTSTEELDAEPVRVAI